MITVTFSSLPQDRYCGFGEYAGICGLHTGRDTRNAGCGEARLRGAWQEAGAPRPEPVPGRTGPGDRENRHRGLRGHRGSARSRRLRSPQCEGAPVPGEHLRYPYSRVAGIEVSPATPVFPDDHATVMSGIAIAGSEFPEIEKDTEVVADIHGSGIVFSRTGP